MKKVTKFAVQLLLTAALASGMVAQANSSANSANKDKPEAVQTGAAAASSADYVIGADDTLHISVWKEPDLTATLPVRPDGKISLPLLNDVPAAGLTPLQSSASITENLNKYIADPPLPLLLSPLNTR